MRDGRRAHVAEQRARAQRGVGDAAPFCVRQADEAHGPRAAKFALQLRSDGACHFGRAERGGEQQTHPFRHERAGGGVMARARRGGEAEVDRIIQCRLHRSSERRELQRHACGGGLVAAGAPCAGRGIAGWIRVEPVAPDLQLVLPRRLAFGSHAACDLESQLEEAFRRAIVLRAERTRVHVHIPFHELEPLRCGDHLDGGDEWEVGDRAVAGGEVDDVAPRRHLPRDRLEVVPRRVHEAVPRALHAAAVRQLAPLAAAHGRQPLAVLEHMLEAHAGVALHRRPQRLERNVVQPAIHIPTGRIAFRRGAVRSGVASEAADRL
mmetsp:Transcript_17010/g.40582  ORF Transcript_17010/g.40582 Transcript_17010/m.40582 type:complete len:322 (-) Transcript_17010:560-1525(-)